MSEVSRDQCDEKERDCEFVLGRTVNYAEITLFVDSEGEVDLKDNR